MKIKAGSLLETKIQKDILYPFEFTYVGAFKWYEAREAMQHPQDGKDYMILIKGYCPKRKFELDIQMPKDKEIEIR